MTVITLPCET